VIRLRSRLDRRFTPIYVCGVAGSGNTLLAGLLHQRYATCAFLRESALRADERSPLRMEKAVTYGTLARFRAALEIPAGATVRAIRDASLRLYRREAEYPKASRFVVDKGPNAHCLRAAWLKRAFPDARFVLIHRDPAANVEGLRRKWPEIFGAAPLEEVCDFWRDLHGRFLADTRPFSRDVLVISYAELVADPEARLREAAWFCGLRARTGRQLLGDLANEPGKGLRNVVGGEIRVVGNADRAARERLPAPERAIVQARLAGTAEALANWRP
jgi:hypothetical protein